MSHIETKWVASPVVTDVSVFDVSKGFIVSLMLLAEEAI